MISLCFPKIGVNLQFLKKQIEIKLLHPESTLESRIQVIIIMYSGWLGKFNLGSLLGPVNTT
ncbi:MAG: hypothetical protein P8X89_03020 [Reinekea sp.]